VVHEPEVLQLVEKAARQQAAGTCRVEPQVSTIGNDVNSNLHRTHIVQGSLLLILRGQEHMNGRSNMKTPLSRERA